MAWELEALCAGKLNSVILKTDNGWYPHPHGARSVAPYSWTLVPAQSLGAVWIFCKHERVCWQAPPTGLGPVGKWNADGKATGNPGDDEAFTFTRALDDPTKVSLLTCVVVAVFRAWSYFHRILCPFVGQVHIRSKDNAYYNIDTHSMVAGIESATKFTAATEIKEIPLPLF